MNWLLSVHIMLTATSIAALCAVVYYAQASLSSAPARTLRSQALEIAALQSEVENLTVQLKRQHMRLAQKARQSSASDEPPPPPQIDALNGDGRDALRKQLAAQAGTIAPRR